jgi:molybdopterin converting factor small subunit
MSAGAGEDRTTIEVEVLAFAALGERLGGRRRRVTLPTGARAGDLWPALGLGPSAPAAVRYALDVDWIAPDHVLRDGDTIAVITPVSGG